MDISIKKFPYRYMEYEKDMMKREIEIMFPHAIPMLDRREPAISNLQEEDLAKLYWLTFISEYKVGDQWHETYQCRVEKDDTLKVAKQHTRYSTHGIHEYKGKFNPQIVHCMINLFGINENSRVLDPFNGSGTTILECAHMGIHADGTDINPMACFISNAKINALSIDVETAKKSINSFFETYHGPVESIIDSDDLRMGYLKKWIPEETLRILEDIREYADKQDEVLQGLILTLTSDLIRDYSYQEPFDLRIRRRKTPMPEAPLLQVLKENINKHLRKIEEIQLCLGPIETENQAINCDIKVANPFGGVLFDAALTSPPYVTALPYIDTQRISLVWLGLCSADEIRDLEASLIGSREMLYKEKNKWNESMANNEADLPDELYSLVCEMQSSLSDSDGFRKQAVPVLLYRYLSEMKSMFLNVSTMLKNGAPYALIVGHNKTTLGGKRFFLNTPELLAKLAQSCGWDTEEIIPLETYKRYGINSKNAIGEESMLVLRNRNSVDL